MSNDWAGHLSINKLHALRGNLSEATLPLEECEGDTLDFLVAENDATVEDGRVAITEKGRNTLEHETKARAGEGAPAA